MRNKRDEDTLYIGTKFYGHDTAVFAIFLDEKEVFAVETERLTRYKHDSLHPIRAIEKLLEYKKIDNKKVKKIFFSNSVVLQKKEILDDEDYEISLAHRSHFKSKYIGQWEKRFQELQRKNKFHKFFDLARTFCGQKILLFALKKRLKLNRKKTLDQIIKKHLKNIFPRAEVHVDYFDHQLCHALSSYFTSNFDDALLLTSDGFGDNSFSSLYIASKDEIRKINSSSIKEIELNFQGGVKTIGLSPGIIYSFFTEKLGFKPDSDEGKTEALAAFGKWDNEVFHFLADNTKVDKEKDAIILNENKIEKYLDQKNFEKLLKKYRKEDLAAAAQRYLEDIHIEYIKQIMNKTGIRNLCFSGGVAANVILNLRIYEEITRNLHIAPAMGDDGTAQGAVIATLLERGLAIGDLKWLKEKTMPYFSTSYSREEVIGAIKKYNKKIDYIDLSDRWQEEAANLVFEGKIGAIFHGRMEWGPRALGNRSIVADPRIKDIRKIINLNIKKRPEFQPFCPSILFEEKDRLFHDAYNNKHMTCAFRMRKEFWDILPGAIHVDGTSRVQFVEDGDNPGYYKFLKAFKNLSGFGVIVNTSFNKHGRTIVESPTDALVDFFDTNLDFLIMEGLLIKK